MSGVAANDYKQPLFQISYGARKALGIGGSASVGFVYNPNNSWDSGFTITIGIGIGLEVAAITLLNEGLTKAIDLSSSTIDFSKPTSTEQIEGVSTTVYAGAGIGLSADLFDGTSKAVTTGTIGGGVYTEATVVITAGKIAENIVNTGIGVMNAVLDHSGMSKLIGHFKYVELDGRE